MLDLCHVIGYIAAEVGSVCYVTAIGNGRSMRIFLIRYITKMKTLAYTLYLKKNKRQSPGSEYPTSSTQNVSGVGEYDRNYRKSTKHWSQGV